MGVLLLWILVISVRPDSNFEERKAPSGTSSGTFSRTPLVRDLQVGSQGTKGFFFAYDKTEGKEVVFQLVQYALGESGNIKHTDDNAEFAKLNVLVGAAVGATRALRSPSA